DRILTAERAFSVGDVTRGQVFAYTYGTGDHSERIASVTLRLLDEDGWSQSQRAEYAYYDANQEGGLLGDLKTATRQLRREGTGWVALGTEYYRYYKGVTGEPGFAHALKYVVSPEAYARLVAAYGQVDLAPEGVVATYADNYFEYDGQSRVVKETTSGGRETVTLAFTTNSDPSYADGPNNWKFKTVATRPDGSLSTVYANHLGMLMLQEESDAAVTQRWIWYSQYNDDYRIVLSAAPSAIDLSASPVYDPGELNLAVQLRLSEGLITTYEYYDDSTDFEGYSKSRSVQKGAEGLPNKQEQVDFGSHTAAGVTVHPLIERTLYRENEGMDPISTTYEYLFHSGTNQFSQRTTTLPTVPTAENGSNATTEQREQYDLFGNMTWEQGPKGFIDRFHYDVTTGAMTERIRDVDPATVTLPSGWSRPSGLPAPLNLVTTYENDAQGRTTQVLGPPHDIDGVTVRTAQWTIYHDAARETLTAQGTAAIDGASYDYALINPVTISHRDRNGRLVDRIQAVRTSGEGRLCLSNEFPQATWVAWARELYDDGGRLAASRAYHTVPVSGSGSVGTDYNETTYGYDARGRRNRTRTPGGTITRTTLDVLGRTTSVWIGTADIGATDADPGAGGTGNNMAPITSQTYSGDCDCGQPATETRHVDASSGNDRVTTFTYDYRNRLVEIDGEEGFFEARSYDNLDRVVQIERHIDDSSGVLVSRDVNHYDVRGQVYKTEHFGADSGGTPTVAIVGLNWYDAAGNLVASVASGAKDLRAFTKSEFDGDGRNTASYHTIYTGSQPPSYSDATSVTNSDRVFDQTQNTFDPAGNLTLVAVYSRFPGSSAVNKLTTGDSRRFRSANWYDGIGRATAGVLYGTADTVRPPGPPISTDAAPVTLRRYNAAGRAYETVDPLLRVTRTEFDALGRITATISNFTGCECPGNGTDVIVRQAYDGDGHLVRLTAENPATGPQITTYVYGVVPPDSTLSSNDLLSSTVYPDAVDGSDRVSYGYNRQGQQIRIVDQNGTVRELVYDKLGRLVIERVVTLGSGVDGAVRRVETVYDSRGRVETRTNYSAPTGGTIVNQLKYEYDAFGRVTREYQSHSGAVT
ncbi:MAG: RHS repeat-associated core domain-containing protein, partial [Planctomycetes bacterium]|nr:RHS repeat-associated core domain-containing protein [Planctomycetota bacterium]